MVNNQTSQYELMDLNSYLSCLGVFQHVREILQMSLSLDHPVVWLAEAWVSVRWCGGACKTVLLCGVAWITVL